MLSFEPSIVFIDDKIEQVDGIIELYRKEGIGVKYYNADLVEGDSKPETPFSNVNLVFLDLYYQEDFEIDFCLGWLDSILPDNSFYVLVIWSKDTHHSEEIIEGLAGINKKPFITFCETKNDDYKNADTSFKWDELKEKIDTELAALPQLEELAIWKKGILISSNSIIGHLAKDVDADALRKKMQKIVLGHGGTSFIGENRINEKREILFDALDNILVSNSKLTRTNQDISEENINSLYKIEGFPKTDIDSKLNSWFHFILQNPIPEDYINPGLICVFNNESLIKNYNIKGDRTISEYLTFQTEPEGDDKPKLIDISMVISRPCDVAQNKYGRNLKLLSGLLIVNPIRKKNKLKGKDSTPLSLKIFDHLYLNEEQNDCALIFDFRYSFSLPPEIFHERFQKIKIFNKELLSEIQVEYSSYSSRLGITQII